MSSICRVTPGTPSVQAAPVSCVAFRADGRRLASGTQDGKVTVRETSDPSRPVVMTEFAHRSAVLAAAWNPGASDLLAIGSAEGTAAVWRVVDDRPPHLMKVLGGHPAPVTGVSWMPDGQHLLCQLADGRAAVWQAFGEKYLGELDDCVRLDVSSTGLVATVGANGFVAVRNLAQDRSPLAGRAAPAVEACAWSPDATTLALARRDGAIEMRNAHLDPVRSLTAGDAPLRSVTWSADGRHVLAGAYDGTLTALDSANRPHWRLTDPTIRARSLAIGGPVLATATFAGRPYLLDATSGTPLTPGLSLPALPAPTRPFRDGVLAAEGRVVTAGPPDDRTVVVEHDLRVGAIDSLADRVVVSAAHQAVRVARLDPLAYEVERGITLRAPEPVRTVALLGTPEITVVVAASYDFRLYSWTVDWTGPPVGPGVVGEFGAGIAALQRLDEQRLTATDHRGELVILALGADGALNS
ncbi:WD domain G-beta repeat uncharacterized protein [Paractinoplanes brasiliensis]|uniref:WD domain G-beta repeat uncharacterized protein n=1 Tax=Paractinoplanes brasiliensis TaxID=52695 RepID=A0A4R6J9R2_9ACTN|nr:WD domain G-beta repeat uncharacterized protein [Actinoplanes brasiliensis]